MSLGKLNVSLLLSLGKLNVSLLLSLDGVLMLLFDRLFLRKRVAQSTGDRILLKMKVEVLT
ncbi:hypothetical protein ACLK4E_04935 [Leptospira borgpetersenii]|uniref:Uncharacterized protein n=1 Tax=Leptospira borgpetersenii serovar Ballum TaxID=280505 RepID=A0A0S2ILR2_LEPBO|nr:hypothetical protein [Leptospira borgpetersenii]ALO24604.1 hypothetical protein LBBP_00239 [Leptospira borgpetersenii serovar Ballum]OOV45454.1 hypothetical protein B1H38_05505 [Leptospira borgpetersenii serovar Ballum]QHE25756.1 hypothetical protein GS524_01240 [Leptospira borgpetersenii]QHE29059.1 hypothetical protein GS523_01240 [Leptospira borgpetersenii]QHE32361.1 hypothetical protein GS517_01235 [Leptospira borgpetersenii]